jgi:uncharacterized protein
MISPDLMAILVCPADKKKVELEGNALVCQECGRRYPIVDGIPIMLIEEATIGKAEESKPNEG